MSDEESSSSGSSSDSEHDKKKVAAAATSKKAAGSSITATQKSGKKGSDSSSSSSSSSSDSGSSDSEDDKKKTAAVAKPKNKYVHTDSESDNESEKNRSAKSGKEKALDAVIKASRDLRVHLSSDDWAASKDGFEAINKALAKYRKLVPTGATPTTYLEAMVALEAEVNEIDENEVLRKKLSQSKYKAYSAIKSKLAKHLEPYRAEMVALPEKKAEEKVADAPDVAEDDEADASSTESEASSSSSSSGSGSDSDSSSSSSSSDSDGDDSSEFDSDSDSSSSSSSIDEEVRGKLTGRDKWVKRAVLKKARPEKSAVNEQQIASERKRLEKIRAAELRRQQKIQEEKERQAREAAVVLTVRDVERLIKATASKLLKREGNRRELLDMLRGHVSRAVPYGPRAVLPGLMLLVSSQFETRGIDDCISLERWRNAMNDMNYIMRILSKNKDLRLAPITGGESVDGSGGAQETVEQILAEAARASQGDAQAIQAREKAQGQMADDDVKRDAEGADTVFVVGDIATFALRLSNELHKALRLTQPHTPEFLERLQDEATMLELAVQVQDYLERAGDFHGAIKQALLRIELMYYKHDAIAIPAYAARVKEGVFGTGVHPAAVNVFWAMGETAFVDSDQSKSSPAAWPVSVEVPEYNTAAIIEQLCLFVYSARDDDASKNRALLCQTYHHALHDRYHEARDLFLMSHLQENIYKADVETQILFNRVMAQLGMCAFRVGSIQQAHAALQDICGHKKAKELLAQGIGWKNKNQDRDPEKELIERRRLVPYHMHIDQDLLECCHLTAAMLLEVTNLALQDGKPVQDPRGSQDGVVSRAFRKYLDQYENSPFTGPPENVQDHVMAAAVALRDADWKTAVDNILSLSVWDAVPNSLAIKDMIRNKIKAEALRVYMLTYAAYYESIKFESLYSLFAMEKEQVKVVLSKLILTKALAASWDGDVIRLHKVVPSNLQALSIQWSDKLKDLVDSNEKLIERLGAPIEKRGGDRQGWRKNNERGGGGGQGGNNQGNNRQGGGQGGDRGKRQGGGRPDGQGNRNRDGGGGGQRSYNNNNSGGGNRQRNTNQSSGGW